MCVMWYTSTVATLFLLYIIYFCFFFFFKLVYPSSCILLSVHLSVNIYAPFPVVMSYGQWNTQNPHLNTTIIVMLFFWVDNMQHVLRTKQQTIFETGHTLLLFRILFIQPLMTNSDNTNFGQFL